MSSSLQLPEGSEIAFRNLKDAKLLAMDIGGSLTKIAYYSTVPVRRIVYDAENSDDVAADDVKGRREVLDGTVYEILEGARLHFIKFETSQIEKCLDYVRKTLMRGENKEDSVVNKTISVTGGGAYKFADLIKEKLNLEVSKVDEMDCICAGANFLLKVLKTHSLA
jgi:pantothenate kinase